MLTKKGKNGLKAMIHLARLAPGETAQSQTIATVNGISKKFLDTTLSELRNAGLVRTFKGRSGGYQLLRPAHDIPVVQILRVLQGPVAPISCVSKTAYQSCDDCQEQDGCGIHFMMLEVRDAMLRVLEERTLRDLAENHVLGRYLTADNS